jgi:hypothetical protein
MKQQYSKRVNRMQHSFHGRFNLKSCFNLLKNNLEAVPTPIGQHNGMEEDPNSTRREPWSERSYISEQHLLLLPKGTIHFKVCLEAEAK